MVHTRLNEREPNPNPHVNFIAPLPMPDASAQEDARQLLRALAAQVKPVMKAHGFSVNSLEEYEYNSIFAGRNWNNGEVVELVLRRKDGIFQHNSWLMSTLCHELAHIKHMNHGPAFQALWTRLRNDVRALQSKGYYGDGYWSSGTRLADSSRISGAGIEAGDFPEYMCGGAQARKRPTSLRRRRATRTIGPSAHTGAQTAKKRKAGSRVTAAATFNGAGKALNADDEVGGKKVGTGFRKQASSKRAREERALAAERRILALQSQGSSSSSALGTNGSKESDSERDSDSDIEEIHETDQDRRRAMLDSVAGSDPEELKNRSTDFSDDFLFHNPGCDLPTESSQRASTFTTEVAAETMSLPTSIQDPLQPQNPPTDFKSTRATSLGIGKMVQSEIQLRKQESLGMVGRGRKLGKSTKKRYTADEEWSCLICTLANDSDFLACSACGTPRGEAVWVGRDV